MEMSIMDTDKRHFIQFQPQANRYHRKAPEWCDPESRRRLFTCSKWELGQAKNVHQNKTNLDYLSVIAPDVQDYSLFTAL